MKVTQEAGFKPITVTLETEKEAEVMWLLLNFHSIAAEKAKRYFTAVSDEEDYASIGWAMWQTLNHVFSRSGR